MQEKTAQMRRYLQVIYERQTPERRLADFTDAFGRDLAGFERHYQDYVRQLARSQTAR